MSEQKERKRVLRREAVLIQALKRRKTILPRPYRQIYLDFMEDVAEQLRSRDFWVSMTAGTVGNIVMTVALSLLGIEAILRRFGLR